MTLRYQIPFYHLYCLSQKNHVLFYLQRDTKFHPFGVWWHRVTRFHFCHHFCLLRTKMPPKICNVRCIATVLQNFTPTGLDVVVLRDSGLSSFLLAAKKHVLFYLQRDTKFHPFGVWGHRVTRFHFCHHFCLLRTKMPPKICVFRCIASVLHNFTPSGLGDVALPDFVLSSFLLVAKKPYVILFTTGYKNFTRRG
ncbi:MAG: hypothetical protein U0T81_18020 [Saprospiraceae bacterium]